MPEATKNLAPNDRNAILSNKSFVSISPATQDGGYVSDNQQQVSAFLTDLADQGENDADISDGESMDFSEDGMSDHEDAVFDKIQDTISKSLGKSESSLSLASGGTEEGEEVVVQMSDNFSMVPYGIQPRNAYKHASTNSNIMGVAYNGRMRMFVLLDGKGVTCWKRDLVEQRVFRALTFPKYEYRLINYIIYAPKYNCYFVLGKDFTLKVMNRDFEETCSVSADLRSVLFMLFNPVKDELITGGVGGTKIWQFCQVASAFEDLKPLANYRLKIKQELPNVGGSWVRRVELDNYLQYLYCCSDTDLYVYDLQGKLQFKFERAHSMSITGCCFSPSAKVLITSSVDTEVKVWSFRGGLLHTFRGHSKAVTRLILHPVTSSIIITASLDGTVRMWSLDTMDLLYSVTVSSDGVLWMGLTDDNILYVCTVRSLTLWSLNQFYSFWALTRNPVTDLSLSGFERKTTRLVALGDDSSVRLFARSNQKNLTTVLPPPDITPLQSVLSVCYSREFDVVFLLINPREVWVYTTRTDPSCRIAVWDIHELQIPYLTGAKGDSPSKGMSGGLFGNKGGAPSHRTTENGLGNETVSDCHCLCNLTSPAMMWTDEGFCSPIRHSYLLLGLEDGRILFMDPVIKGQKYMEFNASKDAILQIHHDTNHNSLVTLTELKELKMVQIWDLPKLELLYEVYCHKDMKFFSRLGTSFLTAHENGSLNLHTLQLTEDLGLYKAKAEPEKKDIINEKQRSRPEHSAPIIALDSSYSMRIFCSCSSNGMIRIWDEFRILMTEIKLEESLSAACFLNERADLVVGFKNHLFFIPHSKVCPNMEVPEIEEETFDMESDIYEDPDVKFEGGIHIEPDPVTLENYLVPFDIEFSTEFLEGKIHADGGITTEEEESETESEWSLAPTDIYLSPPDSPGGLSDIDLTLGADVTDYDLQRQMKSTMHLLVKKAPNDGKKEGRRRRKHGVYFDDATPFMSDKDDAQSDEEDRFDLPAFGDSPGPTPSITPPSLPSTPVEMEPHEVDVDITLPEEYDNVDTSAKIKTSPSDENIHHLYEGKTSAVHHNKNGAIIVSKEKRSVKKNKKIPRSTKNNNKAPVDRHESDTMIARFERKCSKSHEQNQVIIEELAKSKDRTSVNDTNVSVDDTPDSVSINDTYVSIDDTSVPINDTSDTVSINDTLMSVNDTPVSLMDLPVSYIDDVMETVEVLAITSTGDNITTEEPKETAEEEKPTLIMPPETEVPQEAAAPQEEARSKYRLSNVKVDVKSLMKQPKAKKGKSQGEKKEADHAHVGGKEQATAQTKEGEGTSPTLTEEQKKELDKQEMRQRRIEKKQLLRERKLPPRQPRGPKPEQLQMVGMDNKKYEIAPHLKPKPMPLFEPHKLKRPDEQPPSEMPMVKMDDELMEDDMWNQEPSEGGAVGLMGMKLDLPPARGRGGMLKKPTIQPVKAQTKPPNQIPDVGASPTKELEQPVTPVQQGQMDLSSSPDFKLEQKETKSEDRTDAKGKDFDGKQFDEKGRGTPDVETAVQRLRNGGDRYSRSGTPVSSASQLLQKTEENKTPQKSLSIVLPKEEEEPVQKPEEPPEPQVTDREIVEYLRSMHKHKEEEARKQKQEQREKTLQLEEKKAKERPSSSFERRKSVEGPEEKVRPFTAHTRYHTEDLQTLFDDALTRYQNLPGNKTTTQEQLYHNDGTTFEENWQERAIGRHKLLRMQKELRQRSAALRRQQLQEQQEEKQKMTKMGSRENIDILRADSSMYVLSQVERANMNYGGDTFRTESSMWGMSRAPSAIGVMDRSYSVMDRPHTYMGNPISPGGQPTIKVPDRPKTAMAALQQQQMEKNELKSEKPFRFKIGREPTPSKPISRVKKKEPPPFDPKLIDPRNPHAIRPISSKSIPSRCNQYILVSRPKDRGPYPMPSPLEEQLLTDRFPNLGMKVYQHHSDLTVKNRRLASSLDYSPYYR